MPVSGMSSLGGCWPLLHPFPPEGGRTAIQTVKSHITQSKPTNSDFLEMVLRCDLSRRAVCGVRAVMKLSVKFSGVKVQHKLSQLTFHTGKKQNRVIFQKYHILFCSNFIFHPSRATSHD